MKRRRFTSKAEKAFISLLDLFPLAPANRPWVSEDGNLLVRDAFKVVPLELAISSFLWFAFSGWSSLSVPRLVIFRWDSKSNGETKRVYLLIINKCVKLVVRS